MLHNPRYARKGKTIKNKAAIYHGVSYAYRSTKIVFIFSQASGVFVDNLVEFSEYKDMEKCFRFRIGKIAPCCGGTYDFTNDLTGMYCLSPPFFQQYLENIPACTLMFFSSFGWKEKVFATHFARSVFPLYFCRLSSLPRMFRSSGFSSVHRETEHVFCFSPPVCFRRYMRIAEEPRSSFPIRGTLWVKTILLNSFQRCQAKTQI